MSPEIATYPDNERVFGLTLYEGEPTVIGDGHFWQCFSAVMLILDLRAKKMGRYPEQTEETDECQRRKAVTVLSGIGMPLEMCEELVEVVISGIPGVIIRCKTRPYKPCELPEGLRLGEHTGYDFELIRPRIT